MTDHAPFLERALDAVPPDDSYRVERVHGELPPDLAGTYYLNGPAQFSTGGIRYDHWLDGDGLVCAVRFHDGGADVTHRFVRSAKLTEEDAAGRRLFRTFGTAFPGDRLVRGVALQSPANISVYAFAGALLAFGEQGLPYELDPATLETRGPFTFDRTVTEVTPFSAHPKRDPASGELINFGVSFSADEPLLNVYEFSSAGTLKARRRVRLDRPRSIHDFALTPRHIAFYLSPYLLDAAALAVTGCSVMDALSWRPELGSRLLLLSRESGECAASVPLGCCYCLHLINAFDAGTDVVIDAIEYQRPVYEQYRLPNLFATVGRGQPVRFVVDARSGLLRDRVALDYARAPDFPTIDPEATSRPCDEFWMLGISACGRDGRKFFDELVRGDWRHPDAVDVFRAAPGHYFAGEPAVIRGLSSADDPLLIVPMCDAANRRSTMTLFRARNVGAGPIAALELRHRLPPLFHSTFVRG